MRDLPITEARHELTSLPDKLSEAHETVTVTRRGKPVLAILPWEEYEALVETLDIMADEDLMASLRQGVKEMTQGKLIPWERAKRKLGL
jgi:prevent-host-death family protein